MRNYCLKKQQEKSMLKIDEVNSYRKKPVSVNAIKWTGENFEAIKKFAGDNVVFEDGELIIKTLEDGILL